MEGVGGVGGVLGGKGCGRGRARIAERSSPLAEMEKPNPTLGADPNLYEIREFDGGVEPGAGAEVGPPKTQLGYVGLEQPVACV